MSLRNNIRKVLKESMRDELIKLIDDYGFDAASRYVGGIDAVKDILGKEFIDKMKLTLDNLIKKRYKGIKFEKDEWGISATGYLPHQDPDDDYVLQYEPDDESDEHKMCLYVNQDDYDYFSSMVYLPEKDILDGIKEWFNTKTKLNAEKVYVHKGWG